MDSEQPVNKLDVAGDLHTHEVVVGQKVVNITEELARRVSGPNPYLGLQAFTYDDRESYGGREVLVKQLVRQLTEYGDEQNLLFVTGASGSGKSSFAQAGLLPALESHYAGYGQRVERAVVRPGARPLLALDSELRRLKLPPLRLASMPPGQAASRLAQHLREHTPPEQVNVIVLDQFEELFTQSEPGQRQAVFDALGELPPFGEARTHVVATLRADHLHRLLGIKPEGLYDIAARRGVALRAMGADELRQAIERPLARWMKDNPQQGRKEFEAALLDRLVKDASEDAALLPLLQMTLREIWQRGSLKLANYDGLASAVERHANRVCRWTDWDQEPPGAERPAGEQALMLDIALALVDVSPDDDPRRDVRVGRPKTQLAAGAPERMALIEAMTAARLLAASGDPEQTVNIIHEALIQRWGELRRKIDAERERLRQRARFEQQLDLWIANQRSDDYLLLTGVQLGEANALAALGDIAMHSEPARALLERSNQRAADERERLRAEKERLERALAESRSRELAAKSANQLQVDPGLGLWLAIEACKRSPTVEAEDALRQAVLASHARLILNGHTAAVNSASFSPDGARILSASDDGAVRVWSAESGALAFELPGHANRLVSAAFTPDGSRIVSGSIDGVLRVWDARTGESVHQLQGIAGRVWDFALSVEGDRLAASFGAEVFVWDLAGGGLVDYVVARSACQGLDISPDGSCVVAGFDDGCAARWAVGMGGQPKESRLLERTVRVVRFTPDGRHVLLADDRAAVIADAALDETIAHYRYRNPDDRLVSGRFSPRTGTSVALTGVEGGVQVCASGSLQELFAVPASNGVAAIFSPDEQRVATVNAQVIDVWDARDGRHLRTCRGHREIVTAIGFSQDGSRLVSASSDGGLFVWDASGEGERGLVRLPSGDVVQDMALTPDGAWLAACGGGSAGVWSARTLQPEHLLRVTTSDARAVCLSPDGRTLACGTDSGHVQVWDLASGTEQSFKAHDQRVTQLAFGPDEGTLISIGWDGALKLWDAASGALRGILHQGADHNPGFALSADGRKVARGCDDGQVVLCDIAAASVEREWRVSSGPVRCADIAHGGETVLIVAGNQAGVLSASDAQARVVVFDGHAGTIWNAAFSASPSPSALKAVTASNDKTARVWDARTGELLLDLAGHTGYVYDARFSPDGTRVVTASLDGTARIWDAQTGELRSVLRQAGSASGFKRAAFSADGRAVFAVEDGGVRVFYATVDDLVALAESRCARPPTADERRRHLRE